MDQNSKKSKIDAKFEKSGSKKKQSYHKIEKQEKENDSINNPPVIGTCLNSAILIPFDFYSGFSSFLNIFLFLFAFFRVRSTSTVYILVAPEEVRPLNFIMIISFSGYLLILITN